MRRRRGQGARNRALDASLRAVCLLAVSGVAGCGRKAGAPSPVGGEAASGLVVESVTPGYAAGRAAVAPGDRLLSWSRSGHARGDAVVPLRVPRDLHRVEVEERPRDGVTVQVSRGGHRFAVTLPEGELRCEARPALTHDEEAGLAAGADEARRGRTDEAVTLWQAIAGAAFAAGRREEASWIALRAAATLLEAGAADAAGVALGRAVEHAGSVSPHAQAWVWEKWGDALGTRNEFPDAVAAYAEARRLLPPQAGSLTRAMLVQKQAAAEFRRGRLTEAEALARDALAAAAHLERALGISRARAPGGPSVATALHELGVVAFNGGDLARAERLYAEALVVLGAAGAGGTPEGSMRMGLGTVAWKRGDLERAEREFLAARTIFEREVPGSVHVAWSVNNLGLVAQDRGSLALAEDYYLRALEIRARIGPRGVDHAMSLINLGALASARGDLAQARDRYEEALSITRELAPGSENEAYVVGNLGNVAARAGDFARAERLLRECLDIFERLAPESLDLAEALHGLGEVYARSGRHRQAERAFRRSLVLRRRLAPDSAALAESLHALGALHRDTGRGASAAAYMGEGLGALDAQRGRLGGTHEQKSGFAARFAHYYKDLLALLVAGGRGEEAFHVLERYRARGLLAMLAERDLLLDGDLPPELARERAEVHRAYEVTQERLRGLAAGSGEVDDALARLRGLNEQRQRLAARVRAASPRLAALEEPRPPTLTQAASSLDAGTVLLSYAVLPERTWLFVLEAGGGLDVLGVPLPEPELRARVERFRLLLQLRNPPAEGRRALGDLAAGLFDALVAPAAARMERARRVLIVPDGALHVLPFAALAQRSPDGKARHLVEWKPLHVAPSMGVYAELRKERRRPRAHDSGTALVAFGDPEYERAPARFEPLPVSREEARAIASLFPRHAQVFLGAQATEERAKAMAPGVRYLHFATHAALDERFPLDSALVLALPAPGEGGRENGFLQAWEVFERVRLEADLVALSGCETGLGEQSSGEGLIGLTRAFHYAGARSVLASLWSVSDGSTAALMIRFYEKLQAGLPKDEALRAAQLALMRGPVRLDPRPPEDGRIASLLRPLWKAMAGQRAGVIDARAPFHWASFQLIGPRE